MSFSNSSPAVITQLDHDDPIDSGSSKMTDTPPVTQHKKSLSLTGYVPSKKCYPIDLHGKRVSASALKTKVRSYKKRNGVTVSKYSRKKGRSSLASKVASTPKICFKRLSKSANSCKASVDLSHSLYVEEVKASIHLVGKPSSHP